MLTPLNLARVAKHVNGWISPGRGGCGKVEYDDLVSITKAYSGRTARTHRAWVLRGTRHAMRSALVCRWLYCGTYVINLRLKGNWVVKGYMQVMTTVPSANEGAALARSITSLRLAAGVQIVGPIRSLYWWRGSLRDEQEWQLVIKTTHALLAALEDHIKANHSYETPEIIATEITAGSDDYLDWISAETRRIDAS